MTSDQPGTGPSASPPPEGSGEPELGRLSRDLEEAQEHLAATREILTSMGTAAGDPQAVLRAVVENARRLCRADAALVFRLEDGVFRLAAEGGASPEYRDLVARHPMVTDRRSLMGRVALDRRAQQIEDVLADPQYGRLDAQRVAGFRTTLGVPMLLGDDVVGVVLLWRAEVAPFGSREIDLVTTFAAEAAIAIRSVDLVRALQSRTTELGEKVEQLEGLREVGHAVSSSLDLDTVLTTIVAHSVQLTDTDGGSLLEFDESTREFRIRAAHGTDDHLLAPLRRTRIALDETLVGEVCQEATPHSVADLATIVRDAHLSRLYDAGSRSVLAVPMLREGSIVGALVVSRLSPGDFAPDTAELLQTFAAQSALAIVNARLFRELERKSGELEIASRHKSEFLASMSHELRTPLNAVIGFSEVLLERMFGELNDRQDDYLRDILASGRHLLELLNDVLDLSKVEAGRMELDVSTFSVTAALEYSRSMVRERAVRHGITLDLDVAPEVGDVETDELRFKQVVLNLLSNAVKFSPDGNRVVLRAEQSDDELLISVTDHGIGVADEDRELIFESFQQAGRNHSQTEGTGLGLTLCRRIVELFGGRLWLDSEVGRGSTFGFTVPRGRTDAVAAPLGRDDSSPVVVVVEDDRSARELLTLYLEGAGIRAVAARDGADGLAAVRRHRPAAVVLDIRLPGMDGWRVLETLKTDPATAAAPVVVVTILDERAQALALGAAEYLVKPVGRDELLQALARVGVRAPERLAAHPTVAESP